jgi:hypothetical protein
MGHFRRFQQAAELEWKEHRRFWQGFAAVATIALVIFMAVTRAGPFADPSPPLSNGASIWDYLFGTQPALGAIRIAAFALATFFIASVAALLVGGRWVWLGNKGIETDPAINDPAPADLRRSSANVEDALRIQLERFMRQPPDPRDQTGT